jgi:hypothetical protein
MNRIPYTYSIIKYVHDPGAGEALNVGVLLYAPIKGFLRAVFEYRFERLSSTFAGFNGDYYKRALKHFEVALEKIDLEPPLILFPTPSTDDDVSKFFALLVPDGELNFQFGPVLAGITEDPNQALQQIFDRMVRSQYQQVSSERRSDDEVWAVYNKSLTKKQISSKLRPWAGATDEIKFKFDHAIKNQHWRVLQPVSMDYMRAEGIQRKTTQLLGTGMALSGHPELEMMYILLGMPRAEGYLTTYEKAKNLLHKLPIKHELIEESEAEQFAEDLADYMRKHGLIED